MNSTTKKLVELAVQYAGTPLADHIARRQRAADIYGAALRELAATPADGRVKAIARIVADYFTEAYPAFGYRPEHFIGLIETATRDHSGKSPEELWELARELTPGGVHDNSVLLDLIKYYLPNADQRLLVTATAAAWKGGKIGFQFLPDPADLELEEYQDAVELLVSDLEYSFDGHPSDLLVKEDRAFYDSLPDRFTVYRGCHGLTPEQAAAGLCWTTRRNIANWFAGRGTNPVVVSARVRKNWVLLAFASEFEVVVMPPRYRSLKYNPRRKNWRPEMQWSARSTPGLFSPGC